MDGSEGSKLTFEFPELEKADKLRELILYISRKCASDPAFASTRLVKLLYHADFRSYAKYGQPITGAKYVKGPHGPLVDGFQGLVADMKRRGELVVEPMEHFGLTQRRPIALDKPDLSAFTARDIEMVDDLIREYWGRSAKEVSEESHGIAWKAVDNGEAIPYETAFVCDEPLTPHLIERSHELARRLGWAAA